MPPQPETGGVSGARRRSERRSAGAACGRSLPVQRLPGVWLSVHMPLPAAVRPALVGRDREQAELATALAGARAGHGRAVLLLGEAGMGKSVLADWLAAAKKRSVSSPGAVKLSAARSSTTRTVPPGRTAARAYRNTSTGRGKSCTHSMSSTRS